MKLDILLFTENCGSSWICDLMGQSKNVAYLDFEPLYSLMVSEKGKSSIPLYIDRLILDFNIEKFIETRKFIGLPDYTFEQYDKLGKADIFLFKARSNEILESQVSSLIEHGVRIIYLKRDNLLKQAISIYKRRKLNISHFNNFFITPSVFVEINELTEVLKIIQVNNTMADKFYYDWTGFKIQFKYEDLLNDINRSLKEIEDKLGYFSVPDKGYFSKITNDDLGEAVTNYEEVLMAYKLFKNQLE
jgi:hypothetical protein